MATVNPQVLEQLASAEVALRKEAAKLGEADIAHALDSWRDASERVGKSWSGSSLGYHSRVYYSGLLPPPAGARFSIEWGLMSSMSEGTRGDWQEWSFDDVIGQIYSPGDEAKREDFRRRCAHAREVFEDEREKVISSLTLALEARADDQYLEKTLAKVEELSVFRESHFISAMVPKGNVYTRDTTAATAGPQVPPHIAVLADILAIRSPFGACESLAKLTQRAASHLSSAVRREVELERVGTRVFVGHGNSPDWRDLKDFIHERLGLPFDEFNRVPIAGQTNVARLSEMLDDAAVAFLVMTAEDEQADGSQRARQNVIHEAGLFQGRLGFSRAIVLLEEGCEEFSNIQGLGQIRFPGGNIGGAFEEVRRVLEREGLLLGPPRTGSG